MTVRRLQVLPCSEAWDGMRPDGEDQPSRTCERCRIRVTNVSELEAEQLDALVEASARQRVCARFEIVGGQPRSKAGLAAGFVVAALAGCATTASPGKTYEYAIEPDTAGEGSWIGGLVRDYDEQPVEGALVLLESDALSTPLERFTNERGVFAFDDLPPGWYTIRVFAGDARVSKVIQLPVDVRLRANFVVNPHEPMVLGLLFERSEDISPG